MRTVQRVAAVLLACLALTARADDSELFLSGPAAGVARANVLFIIDTSGSMDTLVATPATYSTSQTFTGCYDRNALYFSATASTPPCDSPNVQPKAVNRCAASRQQLNQVGYYSDLLLGWDVLTGSHPNGALECASDRGVDGNGSGSPGFAANGPDEPWAATDASEPAWPAQYTVYDGNWLNWRTNPPTVQKSRLDIVKESVNALAARLEDVNIGLMRFNGSEGGAVIAPLTDINTSRTAFVAAVNALNPAGNTPLSETLYEAAQVFRGANVDFGNTGPVRSVAGSRVGNTLTSLLYRSPLTESCSKNFIILLTDGEPTADGDAVSKITALPDFASVVGTTCDGTGEGRCLDDLAAYLVRHDLDDTLPGLQNVVTHTIGFEADFPLLVSTATRGGGEYHLADSTASLSTALSGIVRSIFDNAATFAAPAVPVNAFKRSQNLHDVYVSVFQPTETARWFGNLKRYRFSGGQLVGKDDRPVIDPVTGLFARDAFSFWSATPDGDRVAEGGAASRLPAPAVRRVFTNLSGTALSLLDPDDAGVQAALAAVPVAERAAVIEWALGRDVGDVDQDGNVMEARRDLGDAFHVQPLTVLYGETVDNPDAAVFVATNDGYLHSFEAATGVENWAFVPGRLLHGLYPLYRNAAAAAKTYGLDGEINLVIRNDDGRPGLSGNEQAILLFGMGRGGDAVYAVDVTDPAAPALLWEKSSSDSSFADLGQTWSPPAAARVDIGGTVRDVVVFGGGYDPGQDHGPFRQDTVGNAIYMVDLADGRRVWSAGSDAAGGPHDLELPRMNYSIPAPVKPLDLNGDGLAERFYVGDMGGQLWRFDIVNGESAATLVEGGVLASLGGAAVATPTTADLRRFYAAPDVVPVILNNQLLISINIGSGYRGHPLDTGIAEAFFAVRDFNVFGVIDRTDYSTSPVSVHQLLDITTDLEPELPFAAAGWQLRLNQGPGEKVLGEALTVDNTTFFTSFAPGQAPSGCVSGAGINRLYAISVLDGRLRTNVDSGVDAPLTLADRSRVLNTGIPVTDVNRLNTETGPTICAGTQCLTPEDMARLPRRAGTKRTYWFQREGP